MHCLEGKILSLPFAKNNKFITLFFASLCIDRDLCINRDD
ncbi:hypothetical protein BTURTLESOX_234 [bacterium endosymbiont of Bathymodiolus sp. 5 South]|nr:hypothetical protein BTURTLESOX_234 [bacterium endosymbiont of Bathymodiolus sp. 5 South]VVH63469.1 hypothetical protein BSPWISOX_2837 [uncultured Gammaproteobacteria bacterium]